MRSFERDPRSRPPVIPSLTSADAQFNHWLAQNAYRQLHDATGDRWDLSLRLEQLPHPEHLLLPLYRLHISLSSQIDQDNLVRRGILDPKADRRLLTLIGADSFPIHLDAKVLEASTMDELRSDFASYISKLRDNLRRRDLGSLKKRLAGSWVNTKSLFGHALLVETLDKINLDV